MGSPSVAKNRIVTDFSLFKFSHPCVSLSNNELIMLKYRVGEKVSQVLFASKVDDGHIIHTVVFNILLLLVGRQIPCKFVKTENTHILRSESTSFMSQPRVGLELSDKFA